MKKILMVLCVLGLFCGNAKAITNEELLSINKKVYEECEKETASNSCFAIARASEVVEIYKLDGEQKKKVWKDIPTCIVSYPDLTVGFELCIYQIVRLVILKS